MSDRHVRSSGRQVYGRAAPLRRPRRSTSIRPKLNQLQQRLLLLAAGVIVVAYGLSRMFAINVITVNSSGHAAEIKTETAKLLSDSWKQQNLITINTADLASKLQQADPLLRSVDVRRRWFHSVIVTTTLKQPSLGWSTGDQKYLLDRDGTAIGVLSVGSKLPVVVDGSNLPVTIGQQVTTARFTDFATGVVSALARAGIGVTGLSIKDTTYDLTVSTNKGYALIFDTGRGVDEEIGDLKSVLALLVSQKKTPAQYIDLRIAGKAYYK